MMRRFLWVVVAIMMIIPSVCAQTEKLVLRHVSQAKGLPNNHITELFKDSRGFLWIGSSAGLLRYDGYSTRRVSDMVGKNTGVLNEQIIRVQEDKKGRLWVESESSIAIFDPMTNTLIDWVSDYVKQFGIQGYVTAVLADEHGDIWIAIDRDGLYRIDIKNETAQKTSGLDLDKETINSLALSKGKMIGITKSGSLIATDPDSMKTTIISKIPENVNVESAHSLLYTDQDNRVWIAYNDRLMLYDLAKKEWQNELLPLHGGIGVVKDIYNDSKGNLWIARDHHGIEKMDFVDGVYRLSPMPTVGDIFPQSTITSILEDENGTLLFGTYKLGLYSYNESVNKFRIDTFPNLDKMPDVNCMITSPDGTVWIGTDNSGLWKWNPSSGEYSHIPDQTEDSPHAITCLAHSSDGNVFIGKFSRGLFCLDNGKVVSLHTGSDIDKAYVWSIAFDKNGNLWIGTLGNGVFRYNLNNKSVEQYTTLNSKMRSDYVTSILPGKDGNIYIGTSGGAEYINPNTRKLTSVSIDDDSSLNGSKIVQIFEDSRGLLWIATTSGLKVVDAKTGKVMSVHNAPYGADMVGIAEDNEGGIWVSNSSRLANLKVTYNRDTGKIDLAKREYDKYAGLPESDFNQRSFVKMADGSLAVGSPFGIIHFNPKDIRMNANRPKVLFTDLYMDNKPVEVGEKIGGRIALNKAIFSGERIDLNHNPKEFTIFFTSDNYALPEKTRFKYKLDGYSEQWTECPEGINYVTYTNLSPGNYQLQVVAINEDGYESEVPATLDIKIHNSFWGSPWGWLIYAVITAVLIWIIIRIAQRRERHLLEQESQKEAQRKQEELNQLKFKFFTNVSHDLRTPLTLIVSPLEDMIKESKDERQTKRLSQMRNNAMRLLSLVNQLLDFRKSEEARLNLNPSEGDIVAFARNVCTSFLGLSERKNINLTFYSDSDRIRLLFDEDKMEKILMNLLGNAFKFTPAGGRIDVAIQHGGDDRSALRIQISDTGIGIKDKDKKHIFERFYQVDDDGVSHPGTGSGIGLSMVSEYVKLHDGTIRVTDNIEKGSVFIIELPIKHCDAIKAVNIAQDAIGCGDSEHMQNKDAVENRPDVQGNRKTVLVVDDSSDMTEMLKDSLDNIYSVITASDGMDALKKISETKPDIILTDLMMPNLNGMELCRKLKENPETVNIPIIILTAKHDLGVKLEGLTIGADDYITKPFNLDVLRLRMRRLIELNSKGARRSLIEPEPENIKITPLDEQLIEKAMKYVSKNISKSELSVEELSDVLGMSRVSLYKKIKQITGKSPIEFIRIIRLKRAAQLLRESQLNVSEIAYQTGFNNPKVFSRYFKEEFGILPSAYQNQESTETSIKLH
ncbi:MAG: response regulator [Muribaculaceae bacterium]|nr:response regulator [Muribaculaceae bacterium]